MKQTNPITSKTKPTRSMLLPWAFVLVVTMAIIAAYSLYIPNPADTAHVVTLVNEQLSPDSSVAENLPDATSNSDKLSASSNSNSPDIEEKIQAAKQLPKTREVTEYIERLSRQEELRDKVIGDMDARIREVGELSPSDAARSLLETNFSRHFSPKIASALYGIGLSPVILLDDVMNDPLVARLFAIMKDPLSPDFYETHEAIKAEAAEYAMHATNPSAFGPGTGLILPMLLVQASPTRETAQLLLEMVATHEEAGRAALEERFPNSTSSHISSNMSTMLAYSIEKLFGEISQDEVQLTQLSPEQEAILAEFSSYIEARRPLTMRVIALMGKNTSQIESQNTPGDDELDEAFWEVRDMVPPIETLDPNIQAHGGNHELLLFRYVEQFVAASNSTNGDPSNEKF